jgi:hypothetical protein
MLLEARCGLTCYDSVLPTCHLSLDNCKGWLPQLPCGKFNDDMSTIIVMPRILAFPYCILISCMLRRELDQWDGDRAFVHVVMNPIETNGQDGAVTSNFLDVVFQQRRPEIC